MEGEGSERLILMTALSAMSWSESGGGCFIFLFVVAFFVDATDEWSLNFPL